MLSLQAITQIWLLWLLSLHVVIYLQNEFKHKPKMAFYMYNVLYGSAVSFMRGKLKLLFLLGDNNGPTSSITILKIMYQLSWCLIGLFTFKESLTSLLSISVGAVIFLYFPLELLPPNRLVPASLFFFSFKDAKQDSMNIMTEWFNQKVIKVMLDIRLILGLVDTSKRFCQLPNFLFSLDPCNLINLPKSDASS